MDKDIEQFYLQSSEYQRLLGDRGEVELIRTRDILSRYLPAPRSIILDVGGAAGIYAFPLAEAGYDVHLIDPVTLHAEQARSHAAQTGTVLASITCGDARSLGFGSGSVDAVLLLGPLYHLTLETDRIAALQEAHRVLKPGGILIAAAITRFASFIDGLANGYFSDPQFRDIVRADLASGQHRNPARHPAYFTTAYFHRPEDLSTEIRGVGFECLGILSVEGPAWGTAHFRDAVVDPAQRDDLLQFLAMIESEPSVLGASAHLLAAGRKQ